MDIKPLTLAYVPQVLLLARALHSESRYRTEPYDERKVSLHLVQVVGDEDYAGAVLTKGNAVVGFVTMYRHENTFNGDLTAYTETLYILPYFRGRLGAKKLLNAFERWARAQQAQRAVVNVTSDINKERTAKLLGYSGFLSAGTIHEKVLSHG